MMELKKYKLGDLLDIKRGASLSGEYYATEGQYVRLTCGNFDYNQNCFKENTSKDNIYYIGQVRPEFIMKKGDIITPLTEQAIGLLGSTAIIPESGKYIQSQDVAKIICKEGKLYPAFAFYLVSSAMVKYQLSAGAQQTKIRHTSPDKIKDCSVWIPDYENQKRIASILSTIDEKIALNRRINNQLEQIARDLYDYWFLQFDFPDANGKPYRSSGGKMVYNDILKREIPQGWEVKRFADVLNMYQPATIPSKDLPKNGRYRVYGANGIIGRYDKYNHENSEVAMACRGNSCGTLNRTMPFSWITGNAMIMQLKDLSIHNEFLLQALPYTNISGSITGSGQPQITRESLTPMKICWPSKKVLDYFSQRVAVIVEQQLRVIEENDHLTSLRDELLPLLMNGQVKVKE